MTEQEYAAKLAEVDRLLNDPTVPMVAERVWILLADLSSFLPVGLKSRAPSAAGPVS